jgi:hypothetical protein
MERLALARKIGLVALIVGIGVGAFLWFVKASAPKAIASSALAAAASAGCGDVVSPASSAPGGIHLQPGQDHAYPEEPATSGPHDPTPLPALPHVYTTPVIETKAVHNLEHGYIVFYYRACGQDALPPPVVRALATFANAQVKVIMAPYPALPSGTSFALTAWNKLWSCPGSITSAQATTMARGFVVAFRSTSNAPEPQIP